jgi:lipopolysaccharide biosynthesis glycosyltransferase
MDADILCVGDCSFLWSNSIGKLPFYACRDTASILYYQEIIEEIGLDPCRLFNAGTMIFHPKLLPPSFHDLIVSEILRGSLRAYDGGDQGYLNHYFQRESIEIGFLPVEYNESTDIYMPSLPDHAKRLIHFTGSNANPWSPKLASNDRRWPWVKRWQREWEESSRK